MKRSSRSIVVAATALAGFLMGACLAHGAPGNPALPAAVAGRAVDVAPEAHLTLSDPVSGDSLPVTVVYPSTGGPCPLIVFSHGYGSAPSAYDDLLQDWAAHGFVVAAPKHADAHALGNGSLQQQMSTMLSVLSDPNALAQRVADVKFCIDGISQIEEQIPDLAGRIDRSRIGVGGHSFGAEISMAIAGARYIDALGSDYRDPRVSAALLMSPEGAGILGLHSDSWQDVTVSLIVMTGSLDIEITNSPEKRLDAYNLSPPGNKYAYFIEGATHFSFMDLPSRNPIGVELAMHHAIEDTTLAYWNATLRSSRAARTWLKNAGPAREPGVIAKWMAR